jgi:lipoprotein signal peptidase
MLFWRIKLIYDQKREIKGKPKFTVLNNYGICFILFTNENRLIFTNREKLVCVCVHMFCTKKHCKASTQYFLSVWEIHIFRRYINLCRILLSW